jgi:hypothetical protein
MSTIEMVLKLRDEASKTLKDVQQESRTTSERFGDLIKGSGILAGALIAAGAAALRFASDMHAARNEILQIHRDTGLAVEEIQALQAAAAASGQKIKDFAAAAEQLRDKPEILAAFNEQARIFGTALGPEAIEQTKQWNRATQELGVVFESLKGAALDLFGGGGQLVENFTNGIIYAGTFLSVFIGKIAEEMSRTINVVAGLVTSHIAAAFQIGKAGSERDALLLGGLGPKGTIDDAFSSGIAAADRVAAGVGANRSAIASADVGNLGAAAKKGTPADPVTVDTKPGGGELGKALAGNMEKAIADAAALNAGRRSGVASGRAANSGRIAGALTADDLQRAAADANGQRVVDGLGKVESTLSGGFTSLLGMAGPIGAAIGAALDLAPVINEIIQTLPKTLFDILKMLPRLIGETIPQFVITILTELPKLLPEVIGAIVEAIPALVRAIVEALPEIIAALATMVPLLVRALVVALYEVVKFLLTELPVVLVNAFIQLAKMLADAVKEAFSLGNDGKFLGTGFQKGNASIFGIDLSATEAGSKRGGKFNRVRGFNRGGVLTEDGPYWGHAGERVVPSTGASTQTAARMGGGGGGGPTISVGMMLGGPSGIHELVRAINQHLAPGSQLKVR